MLSAPFVVFIHHTQGDHTMRAALYLRVSTDEQTTAQQETALREAAKRAGHDIVEVYCDQGISGAKGRDKRPAFDKLHKDAARHRFDIVMAWSVDRLGRSLQDLVAFLSELQALKIDLFLHQQGLDTSTPGGKAMFQMMGVFAEFERAMIQARVKAGMQRAKERGTKSGKAIGRPRIPERKRIAIREAYEAGGVGMRGIAERFDVSLGTVQSALA
jgi:DNA invertase Pin-like site-specific DNA recombinase